MNMNEATGAALSSPGDSDESVTIAPIAPDTSTTPNERDDKDKTNDEAGSSLKSFIVRRYHILRGICADVDFAGISACLPL